MQSAKVLRKWSPARSPLDADLIDATTFSSRATHSHQNGTVPHELANDGFHVSFDGQHWKFPDNRRRTGPREDLGMMKQLYKRSAQSTANGFPKPWHSFQLVAFPEENERRADERHRAGDDHVSLADAYPLLIIGQSSLDDLNDRMKTPVPMNRFRPNVVFTGGEPFEEDTWSRFTIGNLLFAGVKPSKRCVLISRPETATKGPEPLATLSTFRKKDNGVYFGQNVIPIKTGEISIGDEIIINNSSNS